MATSSHLPQLFTAIVGIIFYRSAIRKLHVDASHIRHMGYHGFSDKTNIEMADILPILVPNFPKPFRDGSEATVIFHRKIEVMVLVKNWEPFISRHFTDTKEVWLGHDGFELLITRETWRLACVFYGK